MYWQIGVFEQVNTGALEFKNRKDFVAHQIQFPGATGGQVFHVLLLLRFWKNKHMASLIVSLQVLQVLLLLRILCFPLFTYLVITIENWGKILIAFWIFNAFWTMHGLSSIAPLSSVNSELKVLLSLCVWKTFCYLFF